MGRSQRISRACPCGIKFTERRKHMANNRKHDRWLSDEQVERKSPF